MAPSIVLAWHEFKRLIFRWGFLIKVVGAPFLIVAYIGLLSVIGLGIGYTLSPSENTPGFVNQSPLSFSMPEAFAPGASFTIPYATPLDEPRTDDGLNVRLYRSEAAAKKAIQQGDISSAFIIPDTFLEQPRIHVLINNSVSIIQMSVPREKIKKLIEDEVVTHYAVPESLRRAFRHGFTVKTSTIDEALPEEDDSSELDEEFTTLMNRHGYYIFIGLLISVLFANTERFSGSATRERESKLLDVILSSLSAEHYVLGKVLGIVSASVVQYIIWIGFFYCIPLLVQTLLQQPLTFDISLLQFVFSSLFTLAGMIFYGGLITACTVTNKEADQPTQMRIWLSLFTIASLWILFAILSRSDGFAWHILSLLPVFTPFLQIIQLSNSDYSLTIASMFLCYMTLATYLMIRIAGHILRVGIQLRGQELSLWLRIKHYLRRNA